MKKLLALLLAAALAFQPCTGLSMQAYGAETGTGAILENKKPAMPDSVKAEGGIDSIFVSWRDMGDCSSYLICYKEKGAVNYQSVVTGSWQKLEGTNRIGYTIAGLREFTTYIVYIVSRNGSYQSEASFPVSATTLSVGAPSMPGYKLINTSNGNGQVTEHILDATFGGSGGAQMVDSLPDINANSALSALGLVDDNFASYWCKTDWDDGATHPSESKGVTITLDENYVMSYLTFAAAGKNVSADRVRIEYWTAGNPDVKQIGAYIMEKKDIRNNPYYIVRLDSPISANKIRMSLGRSRLDWSVLKIGEIRFHQYDSIEGEIAGLFVNRAHTKLYEYVTEAEIHKLETRLEVPDPQNGEKHPLYDELKLELQAAREILFTAPNEILPITAEKDKQLGFDGMNAWQPLGKVAYAGEPLIVYVGHSTKPAGDDAQLQLVFTQHYPEKNVLASKCDLRVGKNEFTVPQISSTDTERGGQLYVLYTGNGDADKYTIRVSGGYRIPVLNLYGKTGVGREVAVQVYIKELENYVASVEREHARLHEGKKNVNYEYNPTECILNATDIQLGQMLYSLPATQIYAGLENATDKAAKLDQALRAMDQTMALFYQHKGLSDRAGTVRGSNALPSQHINIRYTRMLTDAFIYTSEDHIGMQWEQASTVSAVEKPDDFRWELAREIGRCIDRDSYGAGEVTNNYFSRLLTGEKRFTYENVYKKVTSGTVGRDPDPDTQHALFWQLHLAFDNNADDRHIYENYEDQFNNLFFARVNTYARNPGMAPKAGLTLGGDADQNLMRLACAAAQKNILPFFVRWGMIPDSTTKTYAAKYGEDDAKALYYVNEDARDYRVAHPGEKETVKDKDVVRILPKTQADDAKVSIGISIKEGAAGNADGQQILGYEIIRGMTNNGRTESKIVGFRPAVQGQKTITFADEASVANVGMLSYKVRAVDKYLNYSNAAEIAGTALLLSDTDEAAVSFQKNAAPKLSVSKNSAGLVTLRWNRIAGADGYKIYRSASKNGKYTYIKRITKGTVTKCANLKQVRGRKYYYKIRAYVIGADGTYKYGSFSTAKPMICN